MATSTLASGYRHSARFHKPFVRALRSQPAIPSKVLDDIEAIDIDEWTTFAQSIAFCDWAITKTLDADLGLHAAAAVQPGDFDVLEYAARSCASFGDVVDVVNRYIALVREGAAFRLERGPTYSAWVLSMAIPLPRVINDWTVGVYCVLGRAMTDERPLHHEVHLMHDKPFDTSEYDRILQCPVRFGMDENRLIVPTSVLSLPIKSADVRLHEVMRRYAGELLQRRPSPQTFRERVRAAALETLRASTSSAATVAQKLHISERTMNRRLRDEHTTFMAIFDELRCELALSYLAQPDLGIAEIAFMLGFSQTPAFSRAFKRWTGLSPVDQRRLLRLQTAS